jgi:phosphohistidine phosphatase
MTHRLYLLRHADAGPWNPLGNDFSRSLSSTGTHHAELVSRWVSETLSPAETVLCSPARRTRETLAPLLSLWPRLLAATDYVDSMYNASLNMLLTLAEDAFSHSGCVLMVGHNPGIEQMLANVAHPNQAVSAMKMSTGTLAVIEFSNGFKQGTSAGNLLHLVGKSDFSIN